MSVRSWIPLHFCSTFCHIECVKWLVKHGVETKATNAEGLMAGEILKTFHFMKPEAIAKQCYGYIVAGSRSAKQIRILKPASSHFQVICTIVMFYIISSV